MSWLYGITDRHFDETNEMRFGDEDCAWCGADLMHEPKRCSNRRGEKFCTPYHRTASNTALNRLLRREA